MDILTAAYSLTELIEKAFPKQGLRAKHHAKVIIPARKRIERVMRGYFKRQEAALMRDLAPKITPRESTHEAQLYAHRILPTSVAPLRFPVTSEESREYADAIREAFEGAAAVLGKQMGLGALTIEDEASRYLRDNSLTRLTGDISNASINRLRDAIADAWDAGGSYNQIVDAIRSTFADFSDTRAGMVAQTEVNDAYSQGRLRTAALAGFDEKAWDPDGEACEICMGNVDAGWIGIDEDFPSGDPAPTAHPNCDCSIDFQKGAPE
jgi:hypothetical protein